jgi:predicted metal-dependent hydrolase
MKRKTKPSKHAKPQSLVWQDAEDLRWAARHWATRMGVKPPQVHLRQMTTKWASISTRGRLTVNVDLLGLKKELGEYVIVHELVHLLVANHGKLFKSFLFAYLPDWERREKELQREALAGRSRRKPKIVR